MIKIKLKGTKYKIPSTSELSFEEFDKVIVGGNITKVPEYLSVYTDMSVTELMNCEISANSVTFIHQIIFDVDIDRELKTELKTIKFKDSVFTLDELKINNFGKHYIFGLYHESYKSKKISFYQLAVYSLAVALSKSEEANQKEIQEIYEDLKVMNWREVLPQGFFLLKNILRKKEGSLKTLIHYTKILRRTKIQRESELKRLKRLEKNLLHKL